MSQPVQPQFQLVELSPEEGKALLADLDQSLAKYSATLIVRPIITVEGLLKAELAVFKKVELVPKGVPFPQEFLETNGDQSSENSDGSQPVEVK